MEEFLILEKPWHGKDTANPRVSSTSPATSPLLPLETDPLEEGTGRGMQKWAQGFAELFERSPGAPLQMRGGLIKEGLGLGKDQELAPVLRLILVSSGEP